METGDKKTTSCSAEKLQACVTKEFHLDPNLSISRSSEVLELEEPRHECTQQETQQQQQLEKEPHTSNKAHCSKEREPKRHPESAGRKKGHLRQEKGQQITKPSPTQLTHAQRAYWQKKLPCGFDYYLGRIANAVILRQPRNVLSFCSEFVEGLFEERNSDLSKLPKESYLERLHKRKFGTRGISADSGEKTGPTPDPEACSVTEKAPPTIHSSNGNLSTSGGGSPDPSASSQQTWFTAEQTSSEQTLGQQMPLRKSAEEDWKPPPKVRPKDLFDDSLAGVLETGKQSNTSMSFTSFSETVDIDATFQYGSSNVEQDRFDVAIGQMKNIENSSVEQPDSIDTLKCEHTLKGNGRDSSVAQPFIQGESMETNREDTSRCDKEEQEGVTASEKAMVRFETTREASCVLTAENTERQEMEEVAQLYDVNGDGTGYQISLGTIGGVPFHIPLPSKETDMLPKKANGASAISAAGQEVTSDPHEQKGKEPPLNGSVYDIQNCTKEQSEENNKGGEEEAITNTGKSKQEGMQFKDDPTFKFATVRDRIEQFKLSEIKMVERQPNACSQRTGRDATASTKIPAPLTKESRYASKHSVQSHHSEKPKDSTGQSIQSFKMVGEQVKEPTEPNLEAPEISGVPNKLYQVDLKANQGASGSRPFSECTENKLGSPLAAAKSGVDNEGGVYGTYGTKTRITRAALLLWWSKAVGSGEVKQRSFGLYKKGQGGKGGIGGEECRVRNEKSDTKHPGKSQTKELKGVKDELKGAFIEKIKEGIHSTKEEEADDASRTNCNEFACEHYDEKQAIEVIEEETDGEMEADCASNDLQERCEDGRVLLSGSYKNIPPIHETAQSKPIGKVKSGVAKKGGVKVDLLKKNFKTGNEILQQAKANKAASRDERRLPECVNGGAELPQRISDDSVKTELTKKPPDKNQPQLVADVSKVKVMLSQWEPIHLSKNSYHSLSDTLKHSRDNFPGPPQGSSQNPDGTTDPASDRERDTQMDQGRIVPENNAVLGSVVKLAADVRLTNLDRSASLENEPDKNAAPECRESEKAPKNDAATASECREKGTDFENDIESESSIQSDSSLDIHTAPARYVTTEFRREPTPAPGDEGVETCSRTESSGMQDIDPDERSSRHEDSSSLQEQGSSENCTVTQELCSHEEGEGKESMDEALSMARLFVQETERVASEVEAIIFQREHIGSNVAMESEADIIQSQDGVGESLKSDQTDDLPSNTLSADATLSWPGLFSLRKSLLDDVSSAIVKMCEVDASDGKQSGSSLTCCKFNGDSVLFNVQPKLVSRNARRVTPDTAVVDEGVSSHEGSINVRVSEGLAECSSTGGAGSGSTAGDNVTDLGEAAAVTRARWTHQARRNQALLRALSERIVERGDDDTAASAPMVAEQSDSDVSWNNNGKRLYGNARKSSPFGNIEKNKNSNNKESDCHVCGLILLRDNICSNAKKHGRCRLGMKPSTNAQSYQKTTARQLFNSSRSHHSYIFLHCQRKKKISKNSNNNNENTSHSNKTWVRHSQDTVTESSDNAATSASELAATAIQGEASFASSRTATAAELVASLLSDQPLGFSRAAGVSQDILLGPELVCCSGVHNPDTLRLGLARASTAVAAPLKQKPLPVRWMSKSGGMLGISGKTRRLFSPVADKEADETSTSSSVESSTDSSSVSEMTSPSMSSRSDDATSTSAESASTSTWSDESMPHSRRSFIKSPQGFCNLSALVKGNFQAKQPVSFYGHTLPRRTPKSQIPPVGENILPQFASPPRGSDPERGTSPVKARPGTRKPSPSPTKVKSETNTSKKKTTGSSASDPECSKAHSPSGRTSSRERQRTETRYAIIKNERFTARTIPHGDSLPWALEVKPKESKTQPPKMCGDTMDTLDRPPKVHDTTRDPETSTKPETLCRGFRMENNSDNEPRKPHCTITKSGSSPAKSCVDSSSLPAGVTMAAESCSVSSTPHQKVNQSAVRPPNKHRKLKCVSPKAREKNSSPPFVKNKTKSTMCAKSPREATGACQNDCNISKIEPHIEKSLKPRDGETKSANGDIHDLETCSKANLKPSRYFDVFSEADKTVVTGHNTTVMTSSENGRTEKAELNENLEIGHRQKEVTNHHGEVGVLCREYSKAPYNIERGKGQEVKNIGSSENEQVTQCDSEKDNFSSPSSRVDSLQDGMTTQLSQTDSGSSKTPSQFTSLSSECTNTVTQSSYTDSGDSNTTTQSSNVDNGQIETSRPLFKIGGECLNISRQPRNVDCGQSIAVGQRNSFNDKGIDTGRQFVKAETDQNKVANQCNKSNETIVAADGSLQVEGDKQPSSLKNRQSNNSKPIFRFSQKQNENGSSFYQIGGGCSKVCTQSSNADNHHIKTTKIPYDADSELVESTMKVGEDHGGCADIPRQAGNDAEWHIEGTMSLSHNENSREKRTSSPSGSLPVVRTGGLSSPTKPDRKLAPEESTQVSKPRIEVSLSNAKSPARNVSPKMAWRARGRVSDEDPSKRRWPFMGSPTRSINQSSPMSTYIPKSPPVRRGIFPWLRFFGWGSGPEKSTEMSEKLPQSSEKCSKSLEFPLRLLEITKGRKEDAPEVTRVLTLEEPQKNVFVNTTFERSNPHTASTTADYMVSTEKRRLYLSDAGAEPRPRQESQSPTRRLICEPEAYAGKNPASRQLILENGSSRRSPVAGRRITPWGVAWPGLAKAVQGENEVDQRNTDNLSPPVVGSGSVASLCASVGDYDGSGLVEVERKVNDLNPPAPDKPRPKPRSDSAVTSRQQDSLELKLHESMWSDVTSAGKDRFYEEGSRVRGSSSDIDAELVSEIGRSIDGSVQTSEGNERGRSPTWHHRPEVRKVGSMVVVGQSGDWQGSIDKSCRQDINKRGRNGERSTLRKRSSSRRRSSDRNNSAFWLDQNKGDDLCGGFCGSFFSEMYEFLGEMTIKHRLCSPQDDSERVVYQEKHYNPLNWNPGSSFKRIRRAQRTSPVMKSSQADSVGMEVAKSCSDLSFDDSCKNIKGNRSCRESDGMEVNISIPCNDPGFDESFRNTNNNSTYVWDDMSDMLSRTCEICSGSVCLCDNCKRCYDSENPCTGAGFSSSSRGEIQRRKPPGERTQKAEVESRTPDSGERLAARGVSRGSRRECPPVEEEDSEQTRSVSDKKLVGTAQKVVTKGAGSEKAGGVSHANGDVSADDSVEVEEGDEEVSLGDIIVCPCPDKCSGRRVWTCRMLTRGEPSPPSVSDMTACPSPAELASSCGDVCLGEQCCEKRTVDMLLVCECLPDTEGVGGQVQTSSRHVSRSVVDMGGGSQAVQTGGSVMHTVPFPVPTRRYPDPSTPRSEGDGSTQCPETASIDKNHMETMPETPTNTPRSSDEGDTRDAAKEGFSMDGRYYDNESSLVMKRDFDEGVPGERLSQGQNAEKFTVTSWDQTQDFVEESNRRKSVEPAKAVGEEGGEGAQGQPKSRTSSVGSLDLEGSVHSDGKAAVGKRHDVSLSSLNSQAEKQDFSAGSLSDKAQPRPQVGETIHEATGSSAGSEAAVSGRVVQYAETVPGVKNREAVEHGGVSLEEMYGPGSGYAGFGGTYGIPLDGGGYLNPAYALDGGEEEEEIFDALSPLPSAIVAQVAPAPSDYVDRTGSHRLSGAELRKPSLADVIDRKQYHEVQQRDSETGMIRTMRVRKESITVTDFDGGYVKEQELPSRLPGQKPRREIYRRFKKIHRKPEELLEPDYLEDFGPEAVENKAGIKGRLHAPHARKRSRPDPASTSSSETQTTLNVSKKPSLY